jgi:hypothetical protein
MRFCSHPGELFKGLAAALHPGRWPRGAVFHPMTIFLPQILPVTSPSRRNCLPATTAFRPHLSPIPAPKRLHVPERLPSANRAPAPGPSPCPQSAYSVPRPAHSLSPPRLTPAHPATALHTCPSHLPFTPALHTFPSHLPFTPALHTCPSHLPFTPALHTCPAHSTCSPAAGAIDARRRRRVVPPKRGLRANRVRQVRAPFALDMKSFVAIKRSQAFGEWKACVGRGTEGGVGGASPSRLGPNLAERRSDGTLGPRPQRLANVGGVPRGGRRRRGRRGSKGNWIVP